jgi:hypothetical protein
MTVRWRCDDACRLRTPRESRPSGAGSTESSRPRQGWRFSWPCWGSARWPRVDDPSLGEASFLATGLPATTRRLPLSSGSSRISTETTGGSHWPALPPVGRGHQDGEDGHHGKAAEGVHDSLHGGLHDPSHRLAPSGALSDALTRGARENHNRQGRLRQDLQWSPQAAEPDPVLRLTTGPMQACSDGRMNWG